MAAHTKIDLYQMQSLPLDAKIRMTARRIDAFIDRNDAYISIMQIKWVLIYRLYRTPITVLQSRIIPCWIT